MPAVSFNNSTFEYIEKGAGTPVVFVHGSINDFRIWKDQMEPFSKKYRAIAYSRRYHYPNTWNGDGSDYSVDLHANDLNAFIHALSLGQVHLVGSSYGAYTGLMAAIKNPGSFKSLVLGEPPILPLLVSNPDNLLQILSLLIRDPSTAKSFMNFGMKHMKPAQKALQNDQLEEGVRLFTSGVLGDGGYEKLSYETRTALLDNARELKVELLGPGFPPFPKAEAGKTKIPVLLVCGQNSPKFFHSISDILKRILPISEKITIPAASHLIHGGNPIVYNEKVLAFLSNHD